MMVIFMPSILFLTLIYFNSFTLIMWKWLINVFPPYWHSILTHRLQLKPEQSPSLHTLTEEHTHRNTYDEVDCMRHTRIHTQAEHLCKDMVRRNAHTFGCLGQAYMGGGWHGWGGRFGRGGILCMQSFFNYKFYDSVHFWKSKLL